MSLKNTELGPDPMRAAGIILFSAMLLCGCSASERAELSNRLNTPIKDFTMGHAIVIAVLHALLSKSSHTCNHKEK